MIVMKQARILTETEFKRVLMVIAAHRHAERNRAIFYMSFLAGLRACEISALKIADVVDEKYIVSKRPGITPSQAASYVAAVH